MTNHDDEFLDDNEDFEESDDDRSVSSSLPGARVSGPGIAPMQRQPLGGGSNSPISRPGGSGSTSSPFGSGSGGGSSSSFSKPSGSTSPFSSGGSSSRPGGFGSSRDDDRKDDSPPRTLGGSGGGTGPLRSPVPSGDTKKEDSASRIGSIAPKPSSPSDASKKPDDKKEGGGLLGGIGSKIPFAGGGGDKKADSPKTEKKDEGGGRFGGLGGKLPFGGGGDKKADAKPEKPKNDDSKGRFGGLGGKLPFGGGGDKKADAKPERKESSSASMGSVGSSFGGGLNRKDDKPASSKESSSGGFMGKLKNDGGNAPAKPAKPKAPSKPVGERMRGMIGGIFGSSSKTDTKKTTRTKDGKAVTVKPMSMSLDKKLEIVGIAMVIAAVVLLLSSLSPAQSTLPGNINSSLGKIFGLAAIAVPIMMIPVGLWLIMLRAGQETPILDIGRIIGLLMIFVGALAALQFHDALNYPPGTNQTFEQYLDSLKNVLLPLTAEAGRGGGRVGGEIYYFLVSNFGEIAAFVMVIGWLVVAAMFTFSLSIQEIAIFVASIFRSFGASAQRQRQKRAAIAAERRATQLALQQQQAIALEASAPSGVTVSKPATAQLPLAKSPQLPAPEEREEPEPQRAIPITSGGRTTIAPFRADQDETTEAGEELTPAPALFTEKRAEPAVLTHRETTSTGAKPSSPVRNEESEKKTRFGLGGFGSRNKDTEDKKDDAKQPAASLDTATSEDQEKKSRFGLGGVGNKLKNAVPFAAAVGVGAAKAVVDGASDKDIHNDADKSATSLGTPAPAKEDEKKGRFGFGGLGNRIGKKDDPAKTPAETPATATQAEAKPKPEQPVRLGELLGAPKPNTPTPTTVSPAASTSARPSTPAPSETQTDKPAERPSPFSPRPVQGVAGLNLNKPNPANTVIRPDVDDEDEDEEFTPSVRSASPARPKLGEEAKSPIGGNTPLSPVPSRGPLPFSKPSGTEENKPAEKPLEEPEKTTAPVASKPEEDWASLPPAKPRGVTGTNEMPAIQQADSISGSVGGIRPAPRNPLGSSSVFGRPADAKPEEPKKTEDAPAASAEPQAIPDLQTRLNALRSMKPTDEKKEEPTVPSTASTVSSPVEPAKTESITASPTPTTDKPAETAKQDTTSAPAEEKPVDVAARLGSIAPANRPPLGERTTTAPQTPEEKKSGLGKPDDPLFSNRTSFMPPSITRPATGNNTPATEIRSIPHGEQPIPEPPPARTASTLGNSAPATPAVASNAPTSQTAPPSTPEPVPSQKRGRKEWKMPDITSILTVGADQDVNHEKLLERARTIEDTLGSFGAPGRVVEVRTGPVITQFGVEPDYIAARGGKKNRVKVSAIAGLDKDLQLALGAKSIRIEAPVPGKGYVGIEVPNDQPTVVRLRDVLESQEYKRINSTLSFALGQGVDGTPVAADLASMPHLLIAGTTGSGKSVCVNTIIASLLIRNSPEQLKFIMVDPKRVELTGYNGIPHLVAPVVVELERIVSVLKWVTREMDERYRKFSNAGARNIEDFNKHLPQGEPQMAYIVVIIDELADLMMLAPDDTERLITRLAALARATGIHLVIATQRPSVDVVTGLIKANFPARVAFAVAGGVDSRVILDQPGAERLLGRGDMLFMSGDTPAPQRMQGVYVSDTEINNITRWWKSQLTDDDLASQRPILTAFQLDEMSSHNNAKNGGKGSGTGVGSGANQTRSGEAFWDREMTGKSATQTFASSNDDHNDGDVDDEMYEQAVDMVRRLDKASVSLLQRRLRIGYTRAARLIDIMEERGIIGPPVEGAKPREVLPPKR